MVHRSTHALSSSNLLMKTRPKTASSSLASLGPFYSEPTKESPAILDIGKESAKAVDDAKAPTVDDEQIPVQPETRE